MKYCLSRTWKYSVYFVDYYADGEYANYSTFQLNKIKEISLQVHSKVSGYQIKNGYRGPIHYRLLDLTSNKWIDLGTINNVYLPCDADNNAIQTRITFAASQLEPNHSYEIHIEVERDGKREDIWNPNVLRNTFSTVDELRPNGINLLKTKQEQSTGHLYLSKASPITALGRTPCRNLYRRW